MLKKENRLSHSEFAQYFKIGKRQQSEYFTLVLSESNKFKAAVVVGKKVYRSAVLRNKIRRRVYSLLSQRPINSKIVLILVKPPFSKLTKKQQQIELVNMVGRVIN